MGLIKDSIASVKEALNRNNNDKAITPHTLGKVLSDGNIKFGGTIEDKDGNIIKGGQGSATRFTELTDTPNTISADKMVVGNGAGNALTFADIPVIPPNIVTTDAVQTITGLKTFNSLPKSSVIPTDGDHLVNKDYADSLESETNITNITPASNGEVGVYLDEMASGVYSFYDNDGAFATDIYIRRVNDPMADIQTFSGVVQMKVYDYDKATTAVVLLAEVEFLGGDIGILFSNGSDTLGMAYYGKSANNAKLSIYPNTFTNNNTFRNLPKAQDVGGAALIPVADSDLVTKKYADENGGGGNVENYYIRRSVSSTNRPLVHGGKIDYDRVDIIRDNDVFTGSGTGIIVNKKGIVRVTTNNWVNGQSTSRPWMSIFKNNNRVSSAIDDSSSSYVSLVTSYLDSVEIGDTFDVRMDLVAAANLNGGSGNDKMSYIEIEYITTYAQPEPRAYEFMTLKANTNQPLPTTVSAIEVNFQEQMSKGSKLTKVGNAVRVGAGVNLVMVNANLWGFNEQGAYGRLYVMKNGVAVSDTLSGDMSIHRCVSISPLPLSVIEGDLITLSVEFPSSYASKAIAGGNYLGSTYLTVVVDGLESSSDVTHLDTGWIYPVLLNGWKNYDPTESEYSKICYRIIDKTVYLRGMAYDGPYENQSNFTKHMFEFDSRVRPPKRLLMQAVGELGWKSRVDVSSAGRLQAVWEYGSWISLDGMSFLLD